MELRLSSGEISVIVGDQNLGFSVHTQSFASRNTICCDDCPVGLISSSFIPTRL